MAKRIELSFRTDPAVSNTTTSDAQDTAVPEPDALKKNVAKLDNLQIGKHTVAAVLKSLGTALGQELYPSEILQQGSSTKIFLEQRQPLNIKHAIPDIYQITDGGEFNTSKVRSPGMRRLEDQMFVSFKTRFNDPPSVMVGLNFLDQDRSRNVRITGTADQVHAHLFNMSSRGWADTIVYGAGFTWLAVPSSVHPLLQVGNFDTQQDHAWNVRKDLTTRVITFRSAYKSPPKVVVWLTRIDSGNSQNVRVMGYATDITTTGFKLHIKTWGGTFLHTAAVSWFAYPADTPGICSGEVQPTKGTAGVVTFKRAFAKPPRRILVALTKLEMDKNFNCRFKIIHEAVSERGMGVRVDTWADSKIPQAGVAYIAME